MAAQSDAIELLKEALTVFVELAAPEAKDVEQALREIEGKGDKKQA